MSTPATAANPFWPDVSNEAGPKTHFALTTAQSTIQQHDKAIVELKSQLETLRANTASAASTATATAASASAAAAAALREAKYRTGTMAYLGNTAAQLPCKIITGVTALVDGSFTVTFAAPFSEGLMYAVVSVLSGAGPGSDVPTVWVAAQTGTSFTVNASLATANHLVEWIVFGNLM